MKRVIETDDVGGLESLLGEVVQLFCCRYIYRGTVTAVDDWHLELGADSGLVYETGPLDGPSLDFQTLPHLRVTLHSIESFSIYGTRNSC